MQGPNLLTDPQTTPRSAELVRVRAAYQHLLRTGVFTLCHPNDVVVYIIRVQTRINHNAIRVKRAAENKYRAQEALNTRCRITNRLKKSCTCASCGTIHATWHSANTDLFQAKYLELTDGRIKDLLYEIKRALSG